MLVTTMRGSRDQVLAACMSGAAPFPVLGGSSGSQTHSHCIYIPLLTPTLA